ncbi:MAG: acyl-CoA dehydrogenase family protein [Myxococcota bacterium]|jgi:alkylation response protein AidB-like acyl-CoA dehydrogenase|nr:acyl-CoA dehydrogenase family protein [Myxococcota bacterium]
MAIKQAAKNFGFGEDETMLRDMARKYLDDNLPVQKLRDLVAADHDAVYERGEASPWDAGLWKEMVELGWTGLAVPEEAGGVGFKLAGIAGLVEEVGGHAVPSPLVATLNATHVLAAADRSRAAAFLEKIADGAAASLAITDAAGNWEDVDGGVALSGEGDALRLDGEAHYVQDACKADWLVVLAKRGDDSILCMVPADASGITLQRNDIHDLTRDQAIARFAGVKIGADAIVSDDAHDTLRAAWPAVLVTVAADLVGCAEWQLQTTVTYAQDRKQFERPLGFFQAVKHPLVNAMMDIDRARSLLYHAACCIDEGDPQALDAARMAKSAASDAGAFISDRSVQLHGGIGFTWECDVHLFFKRSMHNQVLYGDGGFQRAKLADNLIGPIGG